MALTELQDWLMQQLAARNGLIEGMPARAGVTLEAMEQAIAVLSRLKYLSVVGPPNQNNVLGVDVDELPLFPYGVVYLRTRRR
jgi:hypothetical protein